MAYPNPIIVPWYRKPWGILVGIVVWPIFLTWLIATKSNWPAGMKVGSITGIWLLVAALNLSLSTPLVAPANDTKSSTSSPTPTAAKTATPKPTTQPDTELTKATQSEGINAKVIKVVDGDTVDVTINGKTERLRLIGLDTPEVVDPRKPVQCFGIEASNKAKALLTGKEVKLEADPSQGERDKYDRLLRYIYLPDGTLFNKLMIAEGFAFEYTYDIPYKYQSDFQKAELYARNNNKGLWAASACNGQSKAAATPTPTPTATPQKLVQTPPPKTSSNCDPNYSGGCVPNVSYDLDCGDIDFSVRIIGTDKHRFDRDKDGYGCESN